MWQHLKSEWEYASLELEGARITRINYDSQTAEGMRGETLEELSAQMANSQPDLLTVLNTLGEEGWEVAEKLDGAAGVTLLLLKRPGTRRAQKDAETRALMKKTLDDLGL